MASSPSISDEESDRFTPATQTTNPAILSPPDSQHRDTHAMPTSAPGVAGANANGKRPIQTISNGADELAAMTGVGVTKVRQDFPPKTHQLSGYTWSRVEEEPGYAWTNKKAVDEMHRAWDQLLHRDYMVKSARPAMRAKGGEMADTCV